jgi:transposase
MLDVDQILEIKQLRGQGVSIRRIATQLGLSRNAVRRYLRGAPPGEYRLEKPRRRLVRERIDARVLELLRSERDKAAPRKQRLSASRIHRILMADGMQASERTVRMAVAAARLELRDPLQHAYLPLQYDPGVDAQVDFMEAKVDDVREGRITSDVLIVRLCYSRRRFRYAAPNQTREALFEGLMRAFEFFGGVPRHLWFDNLTPAVKKVLKGRDREMQAKFTAFSSHYGFKAEFCAPGKGNEKGGVERDVRTTQQEVFAPVPSVDGRPGVQAELDSLAVTELTQVVRGHTKSIGELFADERESLLPLPPTRFDAATTRTARVTNSSWVQLGTNFYSAPVHLVGRQVTVKTFAEEVAIFEARVEVARHRRSYGRGKMVLELEHYLPLLQRKHRGLDRAIPMRQWLGQAHPCWLRLLSAMRQARGEVDGSLEFVEVLRLCGIHGAELVTAAVQKALATATTTIAVVRYHLGLQAEANQSEPAILDYPGPVVQQGSVTAYAEVGNG